MNRVAYESPNMNEEVRILNFLTSHMAVIHTPKLVNGENHSHISNNPNSMKSIKAVILANVANQKNNHAMMIYLKVSFLSFESCQFCININQASNANEASAITHKSVLLSTITRKAHIQLVNRNSNMYHHMAIHFV